MYQRVREGWMQHQSIFNFNPVASWQVSEKLSLKVERTYMWWRESDGQCSGRDHWDWDDYVRERWRTQFLNAAYPVPWCPRSTPTKWVSPARQTGRSSCPARARWDCSTAFPPTRPTAFGSPRAWPAPPATPRSPLSDVAPAISKDLGLFWTNQAPFSSFTGHWV